MMSDTILRLSLLGNDESPPEQKRSTSASGSSQDTKKSNSSNTFAPPLIFDKQIGCNRNCTAFAWLTLMKCRNKN